MLLSQSTTKDYTRAVNKRQFISCLKDEKVTELNSKTKDNENLQDWVGNTGRRIIGFGWKMQDEDEIAREM